MQLQAGENSVGWTVTPLPSPFNVSINRIILALLVAAGAAAAAPAAVAPPRAAVVIRGGSAHERRVLLGAVHGTRSQAVVSIRLVRDTRSFTLNGGRTPPVLAIVVRARDRNHLTRPLWDQALIAGAYEDQTRSFPAERATALATFIRYPGARDKLWAVTRISWSKAPLHTRMSPREIRIVLEQRAARLGLHVEAIQFVRPLLSAPVIVLRTRNRSAFIRTSTTVLATLQRTLVEPETAVVDGMFIDVVDAQRKPILRVGYSTRLSVGYGWNPNRHP